MIFGGHIQTRKVHLSKLENKEFYYKNILNSGNVEASSCNNIKSDNFFIRFLFVFFTFQQYSNLKISQNLQINLN